MPTRAVITDNIKTQFGTVVKTRRGVLRISQEELAGRAGLHRTYISDVERGSRNVSLENIVKLAKALEVSLPHLLTFRNHGSPEESCSEVSSGTLVDILFVEDREDDVDLTLEALKTAGFSNRIHVARDGAAALHFLFCTGAFLNRRPGNRPQLILLDLGLPKIGGLEVLRRIKADPATSNIPVVVLTASARDRDIVASQRLGADAYIVKPVDFRNLSEVTPKLRFQWALLKQTTPCESA